MTDKQGEELLTVRDLVRRYHVSQTTIYNLVQTGMLPAGDKVGRFTMWRLSDIEKAEAKYLDSMEKLINDLRNDKTLMFQRAYKMPPLSYIYGQISDPKLW